MTKRKHQNWERGILVRLATELELKAARGTKILRGEEEKYTQGGQVPCWGCSLGHLSSVEADWVQDS